MKTTSGFTTLRLLAIAGLLFSAVESAPGAAIAAEPTTTTTVAPNAGALVGKTLTMSELAASQANLSALAAGRKPVEQLQHRLPNGALTSKPNPQTLNAMPSLQPNAAVGQIPPNLIKFPRGFVGIYEGENASVNGSELEPPDQGLAANNNVIAEINNNLVQFFNASTGAALTGPIATSAFFFAPSGASLTDTQVFFDATTQRWFFTEVAYNSTTLEDIMVAVSTTSNATGSYYIYHFEAYSSDLSGCGGQDCLPDYPKAGYDANVFIVDVDLYGTQAGGGFVAAAGYAMSKAQLEAGGPVTYVRLTFPGDFVVQPSVPAPNESFVTNANGTEFLMEARNIVDGSTNVRVWAIENTANIASTPTTLVGYGVDIAGQSYGATTPSTQPDVIGPYCKSVGATSAPTLDGGYNAFQATIQKANGKLYGALAFNSPDGNGLKRDVIAWFGLNASVSGIGAPTASIYTQGYVVPPTGYSMSYPALGLNNTGTGVLGTTLTNTSNSVAGGYPSTTVMQFTGTGTTNVIYVTGQGNTSDDGFTGCSGAGPAGVGRWGDYGAAVVDAATGYFYTGNEMIPNPTTYPRGTYANWGTFITETVLTNSCTHTATHDFNGDCKSDIAWRDGNGNSALWLMNGSSTLQTGYLGAVSTNWSMIGQRDFTGNGDADLLWLDTAGDVAVWLMNGTTINSAIGLGNVGTQWSVVGTGDFNGDGIGDILWRNTSSGDLGIWLMSNGQLASFVDLGVTSLTWQVVGVGDFNGDGTSDILWHNTSTSDYAIWLMSNAQLSSGISLGAVGGTWAVIGTGDFNGDGTSDILWRDSTGDLAIWLMSNGQFSSGATLGVVSTVWSVIETGDFDGNGTSDILWLDNSGDLAQWYMNGFSVTASVGLGNVGTSWRPQGRNAD